MMNTYKIIIAYDGTDFHGWQIQPHNKTITSCMQEAWRRVFNQNIVLVGASRTDAGVHALGQVARFQAETSLDDKKLKNIWNNHLPKSISIRSLTKIYHNFHPCFNVRQKTYSYLLFLRSPLPLIARLGWHYRFIDQVDLTKFNKNLQLYVGTHDFGSFCKAEDGVSTIRTIDQISVRKFRHLQAVLVTIKGKSFVHFQIRRMIGYALDVARRPQLSINYLQDILKNPNPRQTLLKAEGCGLCLRKVIYNNDDKRNK